MTAIDELGRHVAETGNRVVRPRDLPYPDPTLVLRALVQRQALVHVAHGYYLFPPDTHRGVHPWRPPIEAVALGVGVADYGRDGVALMGISAARLRDAPPRPLATAVLAMPKSQRPRLTSDLGTVQFVSRAVRRLDRERARTEVADGWTTTPEQTVLDIAARPTLGDVSPLTSSEAITQLSAVCDWGLVQRLAAEQRRTSALARASWMAAAVRDVEPVLLPRPVPALGLVPMEEVDANRFGIVQ